MNKSALEQLEDSELVVLCRRDAEGAFDTLYHRYRLPLFSYIHRMMQNNSSAAEDIFQQTWIKAVRNLGAYQERQRFFAWLCRISHNLIMDFYRSRRNFFGEELPDTLAAPVFCEDDFLVYLVREDGAYDTMTLAQLLPYSFSAKEHMQ